MKIRLRALAHSRAGDKGDTSDRRRRRRDRTGLGGVESRWAIGWAILT
jgi:hypothetical protein